MQFKNDKKEDLALLSEFVTSIFFELETKNDLTFSNFDWENQLRFLFYLQIYDYFLLLWKH